VTTARTPAHRAWCATLLTAVALLVTACGSSPDQTVVVTEYVTPGAAAGPVTIAPLPTTDTAGITEPGDGPLSRVRISANPKFGSTDVPPTDQVTITAFNATITELTAVSTTDDTELSGTISDDGGTWTLGERMSYATTYTLTGTAVGSDGATVPIEGQISTVDPGETMRASVQLADGGTYGVATPIIITFAGQVTDKAAAEATFTVTTDKGFVEGSWAWLQDEDIQGTGVKQSRAHYRTRDYWPGNTTVTVTATLYGADLGDGWGREDITRTFTIGRSQIVKADVNSFHLVVLVDGAVARNYPVSYGRNTDDPELETRSGTHVVQEKFDSFTMCNPKYGYCGFVANWAVRISNNGEFIHENAAVIDSLGKENVSHGCVNMSPADAKDFHDNALYGDPVEVTGTSTQLSTADGDIFDWTYSYEQWKSFSAL
jgi:lipoprotein-anchoring transpeptidase ErfK/SrfK